MSTLPIPVTADDLTADWYATALGRPIASAVSSPLGVGVGLVGALFRTELTGPTGRETIITKMAAPDADSRFVAMVLNMYGREDGFYRELSSRTNLSHPECFYAAHDPVTHDSVLLLEDVSSRGTMIDQVAGTTLAASGGIIRSLAKFHAGFWDDPTLADIPWLWRLCDDPYPGAVAMAYSAAWPKTQEYFADLITPAVQRLGDEYVDHIPKLFAKLCDGPHVLAHADWRIDNLFLTPEDEVIAVDWQLVDRSVGPRDLSYFVTQSVNLEGPDEGVKALDLYLDALGQHGVAADPDWAALMYRYGARFAFVYPVVASGALTVNDPRHLELTRSMFARSIAAIAALDAFDLPL